jgi:integrase
VRRTRRRRRSGPPRRPRPAVGRAARRVESTRTLRRWAEYAVAEVDDDDPGWQHLSPHDLRRTWATALASADVDPSLVCDWGGWDDLETFLDHYRGTFSPEAQQREREKVDRL